MRKTLNHLWPAARAPALALAGLIALIAGLWELSGRGALNPLLPPAEAAAKEIALATAGVYVSLRVINAALSVTQEVEVGAGVVVQPFKGLEPIDDTVERVTGVVFALAAGAALATVGFAPVAALGLTLLGLGLLALAGCASRPSPASVMRFGRVAARIGAALGFVLPLGFVLGVDLGGRLTEAQWQSAIGQLSAVAAEARLGENSVGSDVEPTDSSDPQGLFGRIRTQLQAVGEGVGDAVQSVGRYSETAWVLVSKVDDLFGAMLAIIGIFALRMLLLPALLLWGFMVLMRHIRDSA